MLSILLDNIFEEVKIVGRPKGEPIDPELGKRLRDLRRATGMTQKEFSDAIRKSDEHASASPTTVYAWEHGRQGITDRNLKAVGQVLWDELEDQNYSAFWEVNQDEWELDISLHLLLLGASKRLFGEMDAKWKSLFESPSDIVNFIKFGITPKQEKHFKDVEKENGLDIEYELRAKMDELLKFIAMHTKDNEYISAYNQVGNFDLFDYYEYMVEEIEHAFVQCIKLEMDFLYPEQIQKEEEWFKKGGISDEHQTDE
jgi:transcriptional regulator with XRE-family HTH domain